MRVPKVVVGGKTAGWNFVSGKKKKMAERKKPRDDAHQAVYKK
jgi:hypothetical protein